MTGPTRLRMITAALAGGLAMTWAGAAFDAHEAAAKMTPQSEEEKTIYFLGVLTSRQARELGLSDTEADLMIQGLRDALDGKAIELDQAVYFPKLQKLAEARHAVVLEKEKADSTLFLEKAGQTKGARVTESGLIITDIKVGSGASPAPTDTVRVHYHGTLRDGTVFDSSVQRGEPAEFPLNRVIPCWTEGVGLMKVGGKAKLVCPPDIAYGDRGAPPKIPGGAALTFEVELIEIVGAE
jgi:FKBP-type peptidyl-prolyl cis-trans isomerase FkpA